jgi:nicotinamide mononucleotide transporter
MTSWEIAANVFTTISILLAGRNSLHTWWLGIVGCALFAKVFVDARLYSDAILQVFFIVTSASGWWAWLRGNQGAPSPVRYSRVAQMGGLAALAVVVAIGNGWLFRRFTNAAAPFVDSTVLAFSVLAQFLLMARRVESWWCWLIVNTISVPLFAWKDLRITAVLYTVYWVNAVISLRHWRRLAAENSKRRSASDTNHTNERACADAH